MTFCLLETNDWLTVYVCVLVWVRSYDKLSRLVSFLILFVHCLHKIVNLPFSFSLHTLSKFTMHNDYNWLFSTDIVHNGSGFGNSMCQTIFVTFIYYSFRMNMHESSNVATFYAVLFTFFDFRSCECDFVSENDKNRE